MKKDQNLEKSDKIIVVLTALCALLLFSWLVYDIAFLNPALQGQVEIGTIYEAKNRVKRKFNKSLIWYSASSDETVYENDWIFTGSQSIAKIRLNSGGEIIVEPDSLIILSKKNGVLQLNLQHGKLLANVKTKKVKINVVRDGNVETVDTSEGIVEVAQNVEETAEPEVEIVDVPDVEAEENLTLSDIADRKLYEPEKGFSGLEKNGLSYQQYNYKKITLAPGEKTSVEFNWNDPLSSWPSYEVEVADSPSFENITHSFKVEKEGHRLKTAESNLYHWRVRGLSEKGKPSKWSEPLISELDIEFINLSSAPKLTKNNHRVRLSNQELESVGADKIFKANEDKSVNLTWSEDPNAASYKIQTSDSEDFSNILDEKIVKKSEVDIDNLKLGDTFFRVIPENSRGTAVAEASMGKVTTYLPSPKPKETVDLGDSQLLKWEKVPFAETYKVTYTTDKNQKKKSVKYVSGNEFELENSTGFLQWKVSVVDSKTKKRISGYSKTMDWYDAAKRLASLHGTGQAGKTYPIITKPEPRKTFISVNGEALFFVMNWTYEQAAKAYFVEVAKSATMDKLVYSKKITGKKRAVINQKFKPGVYFMRVRAAQEDVTQESWSEVEVFRVINRKMK